MRFVCAATGLAVVLGLSLSAWAGRYEGFTDKAAKGPKAQVVAATYFGSDAAEEFIGGGGLVDGSIVAAGNSWGPQFPDKPTPRVLGIGKHTGRPAMVEAKGRSKPDNADPDMAGMIVLYEDGLRSIRNVTRFDWGVASITAAMVTADSRLIIAGRCGPQFDSLAKLAEIHRYPAGSLAAPAPAPEPEPTPVGKAAKKKKAPAPRVTFNSYVMKLSPTGDKIDWIWVVADVTAAPEKIWLDKPGNIYFEGLGFDRIASTGLKIDKIGTVPNGGPADIRAVDPIDGSYYFGGDRNTNTGKEPWRQPFLYKYDTSGQKLWKLWEWPARGLRDGSLRTVQGQVSDSSIRAIDFLPDGDMIVGCWSDGGNTVLGKQPDDLNRNVPRVPFAMDNSGMKAANSLAHVIRLDPRTKEAKWIGLWVCYIPQTFSEARVRGAPNHASIKEIKTLPTGDFAFTGAAATGLIETPNAFHKYVGDGTKYGGEFVTLFNPDMSSILFSSYLPGCESASLGATAKGILVFSRSTGDDGHQNADGKPAVTKSPTVNALQPVKKGPCDAHIILLQLPTP